MDFSGEGISGSVTHPFSRKINGLPETNIMILLSPRQAGKGAQAQTFKKMPRLCPHIPRPCHTPLAPAAGWIANASSQEGGRPFGLAVTCGGIREEAVTSVAPSADWLARMAAPVQPATGEAFGPFKSERAPALKRACGGGLPRISGQVLRAGNHAKHVRRAPVQAARFGATRIVPRRATRPQAEEVKRPLPVGCGHHPAKFGPARGMRHPNYKNFRGAARARPSGPCILSHPGGFSARQCNLLPYRKCILTKTKMTRQLHRPRHRV